MRDYWQDMKSYKFPGKILIRTTAGKAKDPVNWYIEITERGQYVRSYGSNQRYRGLAAIESFLKYKRGEW